MLIADVVCIFTALLDRQMILVIFQCKHFTPTAYIMSTWEPDYVLFNSRANGAERRSGRFPGAKVLIQPGYLYPGKEKHQRILKFINNRGRVNMVLGWTALISNYSWKITFHTMSSEAIFV
jgi:hypothetical protein